MAKPVNIARLELGMRAGRAAGRVLGASIANVREHAPAAVLGDVDGIHDMRVAVKRLRETMRLFRRLLPTRRRQGMMPVVELLNDTLGAVRESDVMMLDAQQLAAEVADDGGLCEIAVARRQAKREAAFERLLKVWAQLCSAGLFAALDDIAERTARRRRQANRLEVERFAYEAITRALDRVHERLGPARTSEDPALLHRLRIAVKRLRYSIEPFRRILPQLREPCKAVANAQELLGLIHDFDVLRDALAAHLEEIEPERRDAANAVLELLEQRRDERYRQARDVVESLADPDFDLRILDAID